MFSNLFLFKFYFPEDNLFKTQELCIKCHIRCSKRVTDITFSSWNCVAFNSKINKYKIFSSHSVIVHCSV